MVTAQNTPVGLPVVPYHTTVARTMVMMEQLHAPAVLITEENTDRAYAVVTLDDLLDKVAEYGVDPEAIDIYQVVDYDEQPVLL